MKHIMLFLVFLSGVVFAAKPEPKVEPTVAAVQKPKSYTDDELKKIIDQEVDRKLKRHNSSNIAELTKEIMAKEEQIKLKERELKNREEQINFNGRELEKKIKDFEKEQIRILGCIDQNNDDMKKRTDQTIDVIGNMKPEKAAEVLSVQDSELAVRILAGLDPKKASKIFNLMSKEISARLQKQYMDMRK